MNPLVKNIVDQIMPFNPEKIILFGSYAWGNPTADSDLDLCVIKETAEPKRDRQLRLRRLLLNVDIAADILVYTSNEADKRIGMGDFFVRDILNKGKLLYESV